MAEGNSRPGELVATNAHCIIKRGRICDSRHFWIAALSERPILVEGWSYCNRANRIAIATGVNPSLLPYWNREQLAANDTVFNNPDPAAVERLRATGSVGCTPTTGPGQVSPALKQYVRLRHATTDATIYEFR